MRTHRTIISAILLVVAMIAVIGCSKPDDGSSNDDNGHNDSNYDIVVPTGAINGLFSVDASRKVWFSKGNLQYKALTDTWRFAGKQWDYVGGDDTGTVYGSNNHLISSSYDGWIDLFGWGTSGYNHKYPYMTSENDSDYGNGTNNISGTKYDWGLCNAISNGGNQIGMWRTLTIAEWQYILFDRNTNSGVRYAMAQVNGVNGIILVPDDWDISTYVLNHTDEETLCSNNTLSEAEWINELEPSGAVFLPASGFRYGTTVISNDLHSYGYYWSSTCAAYDGSADETAAAHISIVTLEHMNYQTHVGWTGSNRSGGMSVRLVSDCQ